MAVTVYYEQYSEIQKMALTGALPIFTKCAAMQLLVGLWTPKIHLFLVNKILQDWYSVTVLIAYAVENYSV